MEYMEMIEPYGWTERIWKESWSYIRTIVDTVYHPFLIMDKNLCVLAANRSFRNLFQIEERNNEPKYLYELGTGEWNIPAVKALLDVLLPRNTFFDGFEVSRTFPFIGRKIMLLNGRCIYKENETSEIFPPLILLAMEDIPEMTAIAETLTHYAARIENNIIQQRRELKMQASRLRNISVA